MVRVPLTEAERARGERLGAALRDARGQRSMVDIAAEAGISVETLRKIETGRIPTPAFFTVVALANAVGVPLDELRDLADSTDSADGVRGAGETVPVANQGSVSLPAVS